MRFTDEAIMKLSNDMLTGYLTDDLNSLSGKNWIHAFVVQHLSGNIIDIFQNSKGGLSTYGLSMKSIFILIIYETVKDTVETL